MSESVEGLRTRIEDLEAEIGGLEEALRRPGEEPHKRRLTMQRDAPAIVDEEVLEELVSRLRRHFSTLGDVELVGRTMTWTLKPNANAGVMRMLQITVTPRAGGTRIRFVDDLQLSFNNRVAGYTVGLGMVGFMGVAGVLGALAGPAAVPFGLLAPVVTHQLGKRSYRKLEAKRKQEAAALLDELVAVVTEMSAPTTQEEE